MISIMLIVAALAYRDATSSPVDLTGWSFDTAARSDTLFVMFHSPRCGACRKLMPAWEKLAATLAAEPAPRTVVALVDATESEWLSMRIDVRSYPHLALVANAADVHDYTDSDRSVTALAQFARGGYRDATTARPLRGSLGALQTLGRQLGEVVSDVAAGAASRIARACSSSDGLGGLLEAEECEGGGRAAWAAMGVAVAVVAVLVTCCWGATQDDTDAAAWREAAAGLEQPPGMALDDSARERRSRVAQLVGESRRARRVHT